MIFLLFVSPRFHGIAEIAFIGLLEILASRVTVLTGIVFGWQIPARPIFRWAFPTRLLIVGTRDAVSLCVHPKPPIRDVYAKRDSALALRPTQI
jgi:hypothetical protein